VGALAVALASCELLTHAGSYSLVSGICAECSDVPNAQALRRPRCPNLAAPPDHTQGDAGTYFFAWKSVELGSLRFDGGERDVGEDQDCSDRGWDGGAQKGQPVLCVPLPIDRSVPRVIPIPNWVQSPGGVDNALGQRVVLPLLQFAGSSFDVDALLSGNFSAGRGGQLVKIERWNGLPDDDDIVLTYTGSHGLAQLPDGGAPPPTRWDGTDVWEPTSSFDVYPHFTGYVAGGQLVVDTRGVGQEALDFSIPAGGGDPITFHITARLMSRVGTITPERLTLVSYGRWDLAEALDQSDAIAGVISGEPNADAGNATRMLLASELPGLLTGAADLPLVGNRPSKVNASIPCAAISLALRAEAYPVRIHEP
jgi:hypothetical protein